MTNKELDNYMKTVYPNFDSHIEKGTIEMSNEYYNLLEEKMARLINENKELKEKYENAVADYVHKDTLTATDYVELNKDNELLMSYNQALLKENNELKKQLEEYKKLGFKHLQDKNNNLETQQKKFIKYLEDEIKQINPKILDDGELNLRLDDIKFTQYLIYKEILQKYRSIIGDDK